MIILKTSLGGFNWGWEITNSHFMATITTGGNTWYHVVILLLFCEFTYSSDLDQTNALNLNHFDFLTSSIAKAPPTKLIITNTEMYPSIVNSLYYTHNITKDGQNFG